MADIMICFDLHIRNGVNLYVWNDTQSTNPHNCFRDSVTVVGACGSGYSIDGTVMAVHVDFSLCDVVWLSSV